MASKDYWARFTKNFAQEISQTFDLTGPFQKRYSQRPPGEREALITNRFVAPSVVQAYISAEGLDLPMPDSAHYSNYPAMSLSWKIGSVNSVCLQTEAHGLCRLWSLKTYLFNAETFALLPLGEADALRRIDWRPR